MLKLFLGDQVNVFSLFQRGECTADIGTVVVSEEGNPHSYVALTGAN